MRRTQQGFHVVALLLVVAVIAVAGIIAWRMWPQPAPTDTAQTINGGDDLQKASQSLDDASLEGSLDPTQLDADIESIL